MTLWWYLSGSVLLIASVCHANQHCLSWQPSQTRCFFEEDPAVVNCIHTLLAGWSILNEPLFCSGSDSCFLDLRCIRGTLGGVDAPFGHAAHLGDYFGTSALDRSRRCTLCIDTARTCNTLRMGSVVPWLPTSSRWKKELWTAVVAWSIGVKRLGSPLRKNQGSLRSQSTFFGSIVTVALSSYFPSFAFMLKPSWNFHRIRVCTR